MNDALHPCCTLRTRSHSSCSPPAVTPPCSVAAASSLDIANIAVTNLTAGSVVSGAQQGGAMDQTQGVQLPRCLAWRAAARAGAAGCWAPRRTTLAARRKQLLMAVCEGRLAAARAGPWPRQACPHPAPLLRLIGTPCPQVAEVVIYTPQSWSPEQVSSLAATLTTAPEAVFNAGFLAAYPAISGFKVRAATELPRAQRGGLSTAAKIGIGVGAGGGGALLLGVGIGVFVARRRRRMAVEPRNALGAPSEDLPA